MKILAVDLGKARTGLAVCDEGEILASPAGVIHEADEKQLLTRILQSAKDHGAQMLVVGYPRNMDGSAGARARECEQTVEKLRQRSNYPVELWDERFTTILAHNALNQTDVRGQKRKAVIDEVAACIILEDYLRFRKSRSKM